MVHATIPKSSSSFCNITASHTKPAAQTIPDLMDFVERMVGVAKKLMDKAGKKRNCGFQVYSIRELHHSQVVLHNHCNY